MKQKIFREIEMPLQKSLIAGRKISRKIITIKKSSTGRASFDSCLKRQKLMAGSGVCVETHLIRRHQWLDRWGKMSQLCDLLGRCKRSELAGVLERDFSAINRVLAGSVLFKPRAWFFKEHWKAKTRTGTHGFSKRGFCCGIWSQVRRRRAAALIAVVAIFGAIAVLLFRAISTRLSL